MLLFRSVVICVFCLAVVHLAAPAQADDLEFRTWTDSTGKHQVEAAFLKFTGGKVHLQRKTGQPIVMAVGKLSKADQSFVRALLAKNTDSRKPAPTAMQSSDWRWWRGPNSNGKAAEGQSPPVSWSDTENVAWKIPVPGRGHSSPTIVGNKIFLTTADERSQIQSVVCFERDSGKQLWQTEVNRGGFPAKIHNKNTHATPTVASDGERLYVSFNNHDAVQVTALDLDGKQLWQQVAGPYMPRQYKYGYGPSPLLYKSLVIIASDFDGDSFLTALNSRSGKVEWKTPRLPKLSWSSPIVAHVAGREQLLISGQEMVASYDPNNGRQMWSCKATTSATCGTMVWDGDLVFASGGYPTAGTFAIRADGSGRIVWQNNQKCYEQSMLAHEGFVYGVTDRGVAYCWKADDGTERWTARLGGPVSASPILAGGNIYLSNERGMTFVFEANPDKFVEVGRNQLGQEAFASPTICDGRVFLRVSQGGGGGRQEMLYCLEK